MASNLKTMCFNIWKNKYDRKGIASEYKPAFVRYIGVEDETEYPRIIKTLYDRSQSCSYSVFFDREIAMKAEFDIIDYVGNELDKMDTSDLKDQDITLFDDNAMLNSIFLESLDTVVNLASRQENFPNNSVKNNFILKLIIWTYLYIRPMSSSFKDTDSPKCFYYGDITRHEMYFLMMLYLMTFDVIYIDPLKDCDWAEVDTMGLSELHSDLHIMPVRPLDSLINGADEISQENSVTLQLQQEMDNTMFTGSGTFRPWQFENGYTKARFIKGTVYDLQSEYAEPAKVRNGFEVNGNVVTVPDLVYQVNGVYSDAAEYAKLVRMCTSAPETLVINDRCERLITGSVPEDKKLQLTFCQMSDGTYDIEKIKQLPFYPWAKYRDTLEDFMLKKINETITGDIYNRKLTQNEEFDLICDCLCMDSNIMRLADGFDFPEKVPKVCIFLNGQDEIDEKALAILGYLMTVGMDVVIFSPSGLFSIDSLISRSRFNDVRLDEMKYDCTLEDIRKQNTPKGFFAKLFGTH